MNTTKNVSGATGLHHGHHSHSQYHLDEAEMFKQSSLSAQRKRKILSKALFALLSALAVCVVIACVMANFM